MSNETKKRSGFSWWLVIGIAIPVVGIMIPVLIIDPIGWVRYEGGLEVKIESVDYEIGDKHVHCAYVMSVRLRGGQSDFAELGLTDSGLGIGLKLVDRHDNKVAFIKSENWYGFKSEQVNGRTKWVINSGETCTVAGSAWISEDEFRAVEDEEPWVTSL